VQTGGRPTARCGTWKPAGVGDGGGADDGVTYDGSGALVKKVVSSQTTAYIGNHYEKQGSASPSTTTSMGSGWQ